MSHQETTKIWNAYGEIWENWYGTCHTSFGIFSFGPNSGLRYYSSRSCSCFQVAAMQSSWREQSGYRCHRAAITSTNNCKSYKTLESVNFQESHYLVPNKPEKTWGALGHWSLSPGLHRSPQSGRGTNSRCNWASAKGALEEAGGSDLRLLPFLPANSGGFVHSKADFFLRQRG